MVIATASFGVVLYIERFSAAVVGVSNITIYKLVVFILIWICFVDFTVQTGRSKTWLKRGELTCVL